MDHDVTILTQKDALVKLWLHLSPRLCVAKTDTEALDGWVVVVGYQTSRVFVPSTALTLPPEVLDHLELDASTLVCDCLLARTLLVTEETPRATPIVLYYRVGAGFVLANLFHAPSSAEHIVLCRRSAN